MTDQTTPNYSYQEAPASWNTRYIDPSGFDCQITLRAATGKELLEKASAAMKRLIDTGCTPANSKPANITNGNGKNEAQPDTKICGFHNAEMKKHEKDGQVWYSHKLADNTYCKGRPIA
jgi:hypothetical protein